MSEPWLSIIGLAEDGPGGLSDASRDLIARAEVIFGGPRHLTLLGITDRGRAWPVPFSIDPVLAERGRNVVVLASGDPFWFGAGTTLAKHLSPEEWTSVPAKSSFTLAANELGWRMEETLCIGLHAAPFDRLRPILGRGVRAICTLRDGAAVEQITDWLTDNGFGPSTCHVLERLGGTRKRVRTITAETFDLVEVDAPVVIAIDCAGDKGLPRASGLRDDLFASDGQITKRPVRALTLSALAPRVNEVLWDIGGGSGSISVEWCLAANGCTAIALEPREDRCANIRQNAARFGLDHRLTCIQGTAPEGLMNLPTPDAVFIGGGNSPALMQHLWDTLPLGTRIVANAVTLETESLLLNWHGMHGGDLLRAELAESAPLGRMRGCDRARPILQWSVTR
ncbi:MAG: precorrin-6y C5,15-methyltransferase (decarboxylating) subunit CbiE [Pseudomonadota bacterium]|nr:precorrin-6y C5,15-methyltransferase (decarboxylating) subunit CbiE [Pseudomonadota bacterium]